MIDDNEFILADGGYKNAEFFETPTGMNNEDQRTKAVARGRHETINRRFKIFTCLKQVWRHSVDKHGLAFLPVANITHMLMAVEGVEGQQHGAFQVEHLDN